MEPDKLLEQNLATCNTVGIYQRILQVSSAVPLYHSLVISPRVVRGRVEWWNKGGWIRCLWWLEQTAHAEHVLVMIPYHIKDDHGLEPDWIGCQLLLTDNILAMNVVTTALHHSRHSIIIPGRASLRSWPHSLRLSKLHPSHVSRWMLRTRM